MKIEIGVWANCSESVMRFYSIDPKQIQFILQAIADEINASSGFKPHQNQKIPLFKTAEEYDSNYKEASEKELDNHMKIIDKIFKDKDLKNITQKEADKFYNQEEKRFVKLQYPKGALISACAGLGDNEAIIKIEKGESRLHVRPNLFPRL